MPINSIIWTRLKNYLKNKTHQNWHKDIENLNSLTSVNAVEITFPQRKLQYYMVLLVNFTIQGRNNITVTQSLIGNRWRGNTSNLFCKSSVILIQKLDKDITKQNYRAVVHNKNSENISKLNLTSSIKDKPFSSCFQQMVLTYLHRKTNTDPSHTCKGITAHTTVSTVPFSWPCI